jgi:tetratricopeptide (TPR) repeat protein
MKDKADDSFWWSLLALSTRSAINLTAMATLNGHGLRAEQAADETALTYMALAGYDVSEAPRLLESLREHRPAAALVMYFFVDPVQLQARRDHLNGCIARSRSLVSRLRPPRSGTQSAAEYRRRTESARRTLVELWVRNRMYGPAIRFAKEILAERPDDAHMCYWLGEAYRGDETAPNARALARESYLSALSHESMFAEPHRGLGELAESEGDITTALREYRMYLEQSPTARDRRYYAAKIATLGESDE